MSQQRLGRVSFLFTVFAAVTVPGCGCGTECGGDVVELAEGDYVFADDNVVVQAEQQASIDALCGRGVFLDPYCPDPEI